jgi:hypothetical protein
MAIPPESVYVSREALFEAIQNWAKPRGYAFTTGKSKRMEGSGRWRVYFACDRCFRPSKEPSSRTRNTQSRGTGCLFSVLGVETQDKQNWELKHRPEAKFSTHNHAPSSHPAAHPSHRQLQPEAQALNKGLHNAGMYILYS